MDNAENDGLYVIYGSQVGQEATFMCDWLHYFVTVVYQSHLKRVGSSYLATKGLDIDSWAGNIKDGKQPDFFTLFALNVLLETHTMIHINDGRIWPTMDKAPSDHQQLSKMCDYHLVFLEHGCFAELVERQHPLILVELTDRDVKVLELGILTSDEEETLNSIIFCGLGFALGSGEPFVTDIEVKKEPYDSGDSNNDDTDNLQKGVPDTYSGKLPNDTSSLDQRTDIMDKESMSVPGTDPSNSLDDNHSMDVNIDNQRTDIMDKESMSVPGTDPGTSSDDDPSMDVNIDNTVKESIDVSVTDPALAEITEKQLKPYRDTMTGGGIPHTAETGLNQADPTT